MKKRFLAALATGLLVVGLGGVAQATPSLQLGALADPSSGQGTYVNYTNDVLDMETAFITGGSLLAAGAYGPNDVLVGGQYGAGDDWSKYLTNTAFDGHKAILMATVFEGFAPGSTITINGQSSFLKLGTFVFKNNHYPVNEQNVDFYFFDIGDFAKSAISVPDFDTESGTATGEIKSLDLAITGFDWVHFDLMALVTSQTGSATNTSLKTSWNVSPGSHDVTYNRPDVPVPEPATMLLFGTGLAGLAGVARRKNKA